MAKGNNMKDLLKQRMSAAQQVSEMEIGNRAYESLIDPLPVAASTIRELPVDKLRPFFTTDIGFHPYSPEKLRAFAQQLLEQGLLERIIVRSIPDSDEYEILAGHNRTAAWRMAGYDTIPAEVVAANDARAIIIATATNLLRRQELTIIERGKAYKAWTGTHLAFFWRTFIQEQATVPQYCILKSHKAAVFSLAAVALRFRHLRIFQNDGMEEKRREKEEKFLKKLAKTDHFKRSI